MNASTTIDQDSGVENTDILVKMKTICRNYLECRPANEITDAIEALLPDLNETMLVETVFQNSTAKAFPPHKEYRLAVTELHTRITGWADTFLSACIFFIDFLYC